MFHRTHLLLSKADSYGKSGQWEAALQICESLFQSSWKAGRLDDAVEVLLRIGLFNLSRADWSSATEYFELVREIGSRAGLEAPIARALNGIGIVFQRSGEIALAEEKYREALEHANRAGDSQAVGDVQVNLGIIATIRGELRSARGHYNKALKEYDHLGNKQRQAAVLNNLGMLHTSLKDFANAHECLNRALHIGRQADNTPVQGVVLANSAELFIAEGNYESAREASDQAFEIASRIDDGQLKAEVLKSYGVIFRESQRPHLAESHFRQSIDIAEREGYPLSQADAYRELSLLLRIGNRNRESLEALNIAHHLFTTLEAKHEQADIDKRVAQLEADFLVLVEQWGQSIEDKDLYTRGHCQRVAEYACELATRAGLPERDMTWFRMGAFLHDVGKTEVPEEILNKPGKLTDDEREIIERHTIAGDEILSSTEFPYDIRPIVRSHHERWDGKGYPDRLAGEEIPFTARILHVADVYDALTSARSYRDPLSAEVALDIMAKDEGSFDPLILELFVQMIHEGFGGEDSFELQTTATA